MSRASSIAALCISLQNILFSAPSAMMLGSFLSISVVDSERRPLVRRIWTFV